MSANIKLASYYNEDVSFVKMVFDVFIGSFLYRPLLNTPLWTIKYEFWGTIMAYIFAEVWQEKKYVIAMIFAASIYIVTRDKNYLIVVFGAMLFLCLFSQNRKWTIGKKGKAVCAGVFLVVSVFLIRGVNTFLLRCLFDVLLIILLEEIVCLEKLFSNKVLVELSKYTYAVYAVHWPIICSVGCYLYLKKTNLFVLMVLCSVIIIALAVGVRRVETVISEKVALRSNKS